MSERAGIALASRRRWDGRLLLLAVLVLYVAALQYPHFTTYAPRWQRMGILVSPVPFADMRSLTSAWECTRQGQPVLELNHCDPLGWRPANYPTIWLRLSFLGLGQGDTTALGIAVGLAFLASVFVLAGPLSLAEGLVWSALVTSPSVMLGVNRGNVDILLFALLVLALAALAREGRSARAVGCLLIELAAFLKLFPVFASAAVLQWRRRRALLAFGALLVTFAAYAVAVRHELETIRRVVPRGIELSYGAGVVVDALRRTYGEHAFLVRDRPAAIAVLAAATLLLALACAVIAERRRRYEPEPSTRLPWLWAGAALYIGTWALTENSFDYRLAFCLFMVPQLLEWARQSKPAVPVARVALAVLVATLWLSDTSSLWSGVNAAWIHAESHFPLDELLVWALVAYSAGALVLTRPPWLRRAPAGAEQRARPERATALSDA